MALEPILTAGGSIIVLLVFVAYLASRIRKVGPNQAMIVVGRGSQVIDPLTGKRIQLGFAIVKGGRTLVLPVVDRAEVLSLEVHNLDVLIERTCTNEELPVTVRGATQVRIRGDDASAIARAAERFLGQSEEQFDQTSFNTWTHFYTISSASCPWSRCKLTTEPWQKTSRRPGQRCLGNWDWKSSPSR